MSKLDFEKIIQEADKSSVKTEDVKVRNIEDAIYRIDKSLEQVQNLLNEQHAEISSLEASTEILTDHKHGLQMVREELTKQ